MRRSDLTSADGGVLRGPAAVFQASSPMANAASRSCWEYVRNAMCVSVEATPGTLLMSPDAASARSASRTVVRLTANWRASA